MWNQLWNHDRGKVVGVASAIVFSLIYLIWGFWDMVVVAILIALGYWFGSKKDRKETWYVQIAQTYLRIQDWFKDRRFR